MYISNITMSQPEAFITVKKNRLKLYEGKNHYLKTNTNFEIELFNPTSSNVLAKIWINNKAISASGVIVKAGERVYLERYLDTPEKFQFDVYEVDNVAETQAARDNNGLIKVAFFNEKSYNKINLLDWGTSTYTQYPASTTIGVTGTTNPFNTICTYSSNTISGLPVASTSTFYSSTSVSNTKEKSLSTDSIETGRVGKGEKSKQKFKSVKGDFEDVSWQNFVYQLLPESLKPVETKDIRNYCGECGVRIRKSSWKFCPNCGEAL